MVVEKKQVSRPASQTFNQAREYAFKSFISHGLTPDQSRDLEKSILEFTKRECVRCNIKTLLWSNVWIRRFYIRKLRMILFNIKDVISLIDTDKVTCFNVASVDHYTINPGLWKPIIDRYQNRRICTLISDSDIKYDGLLKCEACKSWNTRFVTVQTRSADEPMTVFATCIDCNTNWTQ